MVPNGWKLTSLGDISSKIQTGPFGSQLHAHEYTDEGIPVLMPKDLVNNRADINSAAKIPESRADDLAKHKLKKGDILFSRRGDVARFGLITEESEGSLCGTGCLKASISKEHSALFLSYFLQKDAVRKWLEQNAVGQTMLNLNTTILSELPIMVASSKQEQQKIAKILTTWDKAISTTERLIDNSTQQKKALMQQLLTGKKRLLDQSGQRFEGEWEETALIDTADSKKYSFTGGPFGSDLKSSDYSTNGVRIIQLQNIGDGCFNNDYKIYTTEEKADQLISCNIYPDEIIISKMGDPVARATLIPDFHSRYLMASDGIRLSVNKLKYDNKFILEMINSPTFRGIALSKSTGSTRRRIGLTDLRNITFNCPTLPEQQKIATVLTNADKEIELLEQQLADFQQEKKALMQQLLTGKKRVVVDG